MPSVYSTLSSYLTPRWFLLLVGSYIAYRLLRRFIQSSRARSLLAQSQRIKQERRNAEFQLAEDALKETEQERKGKEQTIVYESATSIAQKLQNGTYSSRLVLHSLLARLLDAQRRFNVVSETNFSQALNDAEKADKLMKSSGPIGRLHGLPISLKDGINLTGLDSTLGLCRFVNQPATQDALIVQLLRAQGAIFHCKSNIPQTLLSFECVNPLWGRTLNPFNTNLTPGGSSGGESAMLVAGGSVVGIGTDIGGSVRIPAHFSGNTALKPTARRISLQGFRASVPGQEAIPPVAGPMAQCTDDLILILREIWVEAAWKRDSDLVPVAFDNAQLTKPGKLKVGYYVDDGFVPASPACSRAVMEAVEALRADGHTVVEFSPPRVLDAIALYYALITSDNCNTIANQLDGEVWEDYCNTLITGVRLPTVAKDIVSSILMNVLKDKKAATLTKQSREKTVEQVWRLQSERKKYRQDFFDAWTKEGEFDVVLCPAHVLPAVEHHTFKKISFTCSFTLLYNVLDLPAGVMPITYVDRAKDEYTTPAVGILEKTARSCYNLKEQHGLPVGIQVVGKPFKDETVLRAMKVIEDLIQFRPRPKLE